eukprot:7842196-Pyramimonas_sp.AAC.1
MRYPPGLSAWELRRQGRTASRSTGSSGCTCTIQAALRRGHLCSLPRALPHDAACDQGARGPSAEDA